MSLISERLDRWALRRLGKIHQPFPLTTQERARKWADEHGGVEKYWTRAEEAAGHELPEADRDPRVLVLTHDGYPVPKGVSADWGAYWGGGQWS